MQLSDCGALVTRRFVLEQDDLDVQKHALQRENLVALRALVVAKMSSN